MNDNKKSNISNLVKVVILVVALIVLGVSATYAFFTSSVNGSPINTSATAGNFNVTSNLETANRINSTNLKLVSGSEKAEKLAFYVKNESDSTLDATYNVTMKNIKISKNLCSSYFKWELVNTDDNSTLGEGNFEFCKDDTLTEVSRVKITASDIQLNNKNENAAVSLTKNTTQNLELRVWIENDENVNQVDLTEGTFEGKLYIDAYPVSVNRTQS